ncbi:hypothetical protein HOP52_18795 [Halomonas campisalis]|uniref:Uncharacterized protein n=1 Tax=Billgrantia campisalis TaxID=74661 RepID=A0ABS9PDE5_9GAMM|nr:hypothetical protein [Halomonas campisalis]MCG6659799.1 hypothetical protein [Halomonas campisalis]MDR5864953.1 hypothetical protein [Halomonas campisalis]
MNIESLARLIEASDVSVFRSLSAIFVPLIGFNEAGYCDGPHDGGKDFSLLEMPGSGIEVGIQISVDKDWRKKIQADAAKLKSRYGTNLMNFIYSRRIPEGSFEKLKEEILGSHGVVVVKYDSQSIAMRLIDSDKVNEALIAMGIDIHSPTGLVSKYLDPKNEAIASLLLFDDDSKDLRERFFQSIIKSSLSREGESEREVLINAVKSHYKLASTQKIKLNSSIDRLLQRGEVISKQSVLKLSRKEALKYSGLRRTTELELELLRGDFESKLSEMSPRVDESTENLLLENFLELTIGLVGKSYSAYDGGAKKNIAYQGIREIISSRYGEERATEIFNELSEFFSNKAFVKHVACAKLYEAFLNTGSSHLINALGGTESLNVYLDSSVFIPILCGLLYEPVNSRFSKSGASLHKLIADHRFSAIVPSDYVEEVSSHLIEACRDYKHIVDSDVDLSYSGNAFVSHFSMMKKSGCDLSFDEYVKVFGVRLGTISEDMSDSAFWAIRDRASAEIGKLSARYGFSVQKIMVEHLASKVRSLKVLLKENKISRPEILIKHDAKVIGYLSEDYVPSGQVKVLCTWDKVHSLKNPEGLDGYFVMHPIAIIDYLSLAKGNGSSYGVSHLLDFASMQAETDLELSGKVWDAIAKTEKDNLSDAVLLSKAKEFQERYMKEHANNDGVIDKSVEQMWIAWREENS